MQTNNPFVHFWLSHPALFYGITFLLGLYCHFIRSIWLVIPCLSLWLPLMIAALSTPNKSILKPLCLNFLTFVTAWSTTATNYSFPHNIETPLEGKAYIKINHVSLQNTIFGDRWQYQCEIKHFFPKNSNQSTLSCLRCLISIAGERIRPKADHDYWISGKLIQKEQGVFIFKVPSKAIWSVVPGSKCWTEFRYQWKRKLKGWIESSFSHPISGSFLAGLITGEFDDLWMRQQFARFGLQHLLAISGFHFAVIASFLNLIFRCFFPPTFRNILLFTCLALYCFFLGPQASILRAWIMCSLTIIGYLLEKQTTSLNSLGLALLIVLIIHPHFCCELGFQLSFAITAAIMLFYSPALLWLQEIFPKRDLKDLILMRSWHQHGYCLLAFLRQGIALTLAVNLVAFPLTLYHFHQFPWMSLLYNLFYPLLASLSLCLLLLGEFLSFIPFLSSIIHGINDLYTFFILQLTYQIPNGLDSTLTIETFPDSWIICYFCTMTLGGILWREKYWKQPEGSFSFL